MTVVSFSGSLDASVGTAKKSIGRSRQIVVFVALLIVLASAPFYLNDAWMSVIGKAYIAALFALSFNLLFGQAGMLSFGHAAYFGLGAFMAIHAMKAVDAGLIYIPTPFIPLTGAAIGLVTGGLAGLFACRRSGVYFAMVTLAMSELIYVLAPNLQEFFGGESGVTAYRSAFLTFNFGRESHVYSLILGWFAICVVFLRLFTTTLMGRLAIALRENENRLPALGYNVYWSKVLLFAISGMFAGVAGALLSMATESANYAIFSVNHSAAVVLQTFIGGASVFLGPVVGAFVLTVFGYVVSDLTRSWLLYQGLIFIALMLFAPKGFAVLLMDAAKDFRERGVGTIRDIGIVLAGVILVGLGVLLLVEVLSTVMTHDYMTKAGQTGTWVPVPALGFAWNPAEVITWFLPILSLVLGVCVLRWNARRRQSAANANGSGSENSR
ncbi:MULTISPECIES: branched-chain amino acid ABC transporter permease [unclassified Chelatococcus]|uniref:ABC transporter permease subunit n=1 Tax=unclassified Chelatococcus TaxID=2638111 RepID=UPI001BCB0360|nr:MULTISPECIES: branched-chain amino acid ABC transporter permease [unclassified Chelatococcus]MBS7743492.1 branched-chain amino acid ABC transporter permease [Chelatococcus sp. HY11]MBX3547068.1 branched-chain amino acid ABC transporter permease [Chelatococcus sp.]CAH1662465.1 conserved membrane hypothetical protein [Hyphomicrobiales bacterium]CAH1687639.1 conserved membrane hypothetical protein [Hyphomicrobiales bacterium]